MAAFVSLARRIIFIGLGPKCDLQVQSQGPFPCSKAALLHLNGYDESDPYRKAPA